MVENSNSKPISSHFRIHTLIKRTTLGHKKKLENSPHLIIPSPVILDMIYGKNKDDLEKFLHTDQEKEAQWYLEQPAQVQTTVAGKKVKARLREIAHFARGSQDAGSCNLQGYSGFV